MGYSVLLRRIGGALIKSVIDGSKYGGELVEKFSLQAYLKE